MTLRASGLERRWHDGVVEGVGLLPARLKRVLERLAEEKAGRLVR